MTLLAQGFGGKFNFLYIPLDKGTMANVGYAFVNFIDKAGLESRIKVGEYGVRTVTLNPEAL